jgi:hypothetical protein
MRAHRRVMRRLLSIGFVVSTLAVSGAGPASGTASTPVASPRAGSASIVMSPWPEVSAGVTFDFDGDGAPEPVETSYEITVDRTRLDHRNRKDV